MLSRLMGRLRKPRLARLRLFRPLRHPFEKCGCYDCMVIRSENQEVRSALGWHQPPCSIVSDEESESESS